MELDNIILKNAMDRFGITEEQAKKALQEMIDAGLLQENTDPSIPAKFKLTTDGNRLAEKNIIKEYGEFRKVTNSKGVSYKIPTIVIIREGIREDSLEKFPLWTDE